MMSRVPGQWEGFGYDSVVVKQLVTPPAVVPSWTFLTNHAHALVCVAQNPEVRLAEIARLVGIGERAVHSIVQDLVDAGYVLRSRNGRHNVYEVCLDQPLRHPLEAGHQIAVVFGPLTGANPDSHTDHGSVGGARPVVTGSGVVSLVGRSQPEQ